MSRALAAAVAIMLAACAASPIDRLLGELQRNPSRIPAEVPAGTPIVMYLIQWDGAIVTALAGPVPLAAETLALERVLAARRSTPPALWAVVVGNDNLPRWWAPVEAVPKVRISHAVDGEFRAHGGASVTNETAVALRVPKFAGGRVLFYDGARKPAGSIELGS